MIELIKCKITRDKKTSSIPGIDGGGEEEIIYSGISIRFKESSSPSMGKYGEVAQGRATGYAPKGLSGIKMGDSVRGGPFYYKVITPPRQGIKYTVLDLQKMR